jgi:hypothetical protein
VIGCCSLAPSVSLLTTAIPSIAARCASGTEYRAKMGSAVTRPTDLSNDTTSREGVQVKEVERSERVASRDVTVR